MVIEQNSYRIYSDGTEAGAAAFGDKYRGKALVADTAYMIRFGVQVTDSPDSLARQR